MTIRSERNKRLHGPLPSVSAVRKPAPRRAHGDACKLRRLQRAVRMAERRPGGGTGFTILRFRASPLARLIEQRRIGGEEVRAAGDIATAFHAQAAALMVRSPGFEKRDAAHQAREPLRDIEAVARYKPWARHWSQRARRGDRTLEIVIAAVVDERPFQAIETDTGIRHGLAPKAAIAGLRDYAARAGWVDRRTAEAWIAAAETVFTLRKPTKI